MTNNNYIEQFDRYNSGQMSSKERADFKIQLTENQQIMKSYNLYKHSLDAIESDVERNLRSTLKSWDADAQSDTNDTGRVVSFRRKLMTYGAAASVLLLIGFFAFQLFGGKSTASGQQLFAEMYQAPTISTMRDSGTSVSSLDAGNKAFTDGNFEAAIIAYSGLSKEDADYNEGQYLAGHAAIALENYEKASTFFKVAIASGDRNLAEKAEWYFLMSQAATGKLNDEFYSVLTKIKRVKDHSFKDNIASLSARLE